MRNLRIVMAVTAESYYGYVFFIIVSLSALACCCCYYYSFNLAFYLAFWIAGIMHFVISFAVRTKAAIIASYYYCCCYCCCEKANLITAMIVADYCVVSYSIFDHC